VCRPGDVAGVLGGPGIRRRGRASVEQREQLAERTLTGHLRLARVGHQVDEQSWRPGLGRSAHDLGDSGAIGVDTLRRHSRGKVVQGRWDQWRERPHA
jgi:hypothetical protein